MAGAAAHSTRTDRPLTRYMVESGSSRKTGAVAYGRDDVDRPAPEGGVAGWTTAATPTVSMRTTNKKIEQ